MRIDYQTANDLIADIISNGAPASILRLDNTAGFVTQLKLKNEYPPAAHFNETTLIQGGIFPHDPSYYWDVIIPQTINVMKEANILGITDVTDTFNNCEAEDHVIIKEFPDIPTFGGNSILVMDPGGLFGHAKDFFNIPAANNPWPSFLKDKKVLVISTHAESIKHQWNNIDKVWGDRRENIVPFDLVDVIRSPYHPMMDNRQYPNCSHWGETVEYVCKEMERYNFDVLLTGASTSSVFYAQKAKELGKIGIQTGGVVQLFFGILGYRWTKVPGYSKWHDMYNEHWIYPLEIDEAQNRKNNMHLETNFAYW